MLGKRSPVEGFMEEFSSECETIPPFQAWYRNLNIFFEVVPARNHIFLGWIYNARPKDEGKRGSEALDWICELADRYGVILELSVMTPHSGSSPRRNPKHLTMPQLRQWYARRGFVGNYEYMIRLPMVTACDVV